LQAAARRADRPSSLALIGDLFVYRGHIAERKFALFTKPTVGAYTLWLRNVWHAVAVLIGLLFVLGCCRIVDLGS
jgi:hypothetical protein